MKKTAIRWPLICFLTYLTAYLCRVNFSASLTTLSQALTLDYDLLGTAGAAFFAVYAVGQLINGFLGDHIHPVRFVLTALTGTALCNIGVAFSHSFTWILVLWAANGYFQSIFWGAMIRLLAVVTEEENRGNASAFLSAAMPAAYLISWCMLAPCFQDRSAMLFFLIPAIAAVPMMFLWSNKAPLVPDIRTEPLSVPVLKQGICATFSLIQAEGLTVLLAVLLFHGLIKEGIAFWIPTIIRGATGSAAATAAALALLPAANYAGTRLAKRLLRRWNNTPLRVVLLGFCCMLPLCILCLIPLGVFALIPMCMISALSYCINTVLLGFLPMQYQKQGVVSSLVGTLDFFSYMGAALSTYVLGGMISDRGVPGMAVLWTAGACIAVALLALKQRPKH